MTVSLRKAHEEGLNAAVAAELQAEKAAQNLTNQDLSDRSGIPLVSVQRYLAPKRAIDLMILELLAPAVGKKASEIVAAAEARMGRVDMFNPSVQHAERRSDAEVDEVVAAAKQLNRALRDTRPARAPEEMQQLDDNARGEDTTA